MDELDKATLNLKILSNVKEYNKLYTNDDMFYIDEYKIPLIRRYYNERRETNFDCIEKNIDIVVNFINKTNEKKENSDNIKLYVVILIQSIKGIKNLIKTYSTDKSFCAKLELLTKKKIKLFIKSVEVKYPQLKDIIQEYYELIQED